MEPYLVRRLAVARGEGVGEGLCADAVDRRDKVGVGDGGVARLDVVAQAQKQGSS